MQDIDGIMWCFRKKETEDNLYMEYAVGEDEQYAVVAVFDRKKQFSDLDSEKTSKTDPFYRYQCRVNSLVQLVPCRMFYIIGGNDPPWHIIEVDIHTGQRGAATEFTRDTYEQLWISLGLYKLRDELNKWFNDGAYRF